MRKWLLTLLLGTLLLVGGNGHVQAAGKPPRKSTPVNVVNMRDPRPETGAQEGDSGVYYLYILHDPALPAGWVYVQQYLVGSGCQGYTCGSNWQPNSVRNLFEKPADRTPRGHGEGNGLPPSSLPVWDVRDRCGDGAWAAGTWYHNGYFNLVWNPPVCRFDPDRLGPGEGAYVCDYYSQWEGPTGEGWNFAENDACYINPPPNPQPTPPPVPPSNGAMPTPTPCPTGSGYIAPVMLGFRSDPAYPVVVGQRGDGFSTVAGFRGGTRWYLDCSGRHEVPDNIVRVDVIVQLSEQSRRWIESTLAQRYPGARVKDTYPQQYTVFYGNRHVVWTRFPTSGLFESQDPGTYILTWRVHTQSGRAFTFSRQVHVHLADSTLTW